MSDIVKGEHQVFADIAKALGLPDRVLAFSLSVEVDGFPVVECKFYPSQESLEALRCIVERYHLVIDGGIST